MKFYVAYGSNVFTLDVRWVGNFDDTFKHARAIVGPHATLVRIK